jgi:2-polyprenyl-3-methyl-5-hydroxy-6-metoxy-1,4-benzoquinol methylase
VSLIPLGFLKNRCRRPELMDRPGLEPADHARALAGLRRIHAMSRTIAVLWRPIAGLARTMHREDGSIRVLDLATGGGSIPMGLARRAARAGLNVSVDGCDVNPQAIAIAREEAAARGLPCRFFVLDVLGRPLPKGYDVLTCSLFLHHLDEADAVALLGRMAAATRRLVLVDDLVRSRSGYLLALVGCRMLTGSQIVHVDGPRSVAAAFTTGEALSLAARAGLPQARLIPHWPQCFLLSGGRHD